jgi:hypothetical protein
MTTTRVEIEEIQATKSEKFLAVVLAVFLLIGGIWFYAKADDWVRSSIDLPQPTPAEQAAISALDDAQRRHSQAAQRMDQSRADLELAREAYRTALDAGRPGTELEREYELAQQRLRAAERATVEALAAVAAAQPAAERAYGTQGERYQDAQSKRTWIVALIRFVFIALWLVLSARLLWTLRRRESRYLPLAFAAVACGALLTLALAGDYVTDYIDPLELGPLVLSLVGIAATLAGFIAVQRYLAQRIPVSRVRKSECPFCGYPVRGDGPHCQGCGREVIGECGTCGRPRRVGTARCAACGAA